MWGDKLINEPIHVDLSIAFHDNGFVSIGVPGHMQQVSHNFGAKQAALIQKAAETFRYWREKFAEEEQ